MDFVENLEMMHIVGGACVCVCVCWGVRGNLFAYKNPCVSGPLFLSTFVTIEKIMIKTESKLIYP